MQAGNRTQVLHRSLRGRASYFRENESIVTGSTGAPSVSLLPGVIPAAARLATTSSPDVTLPLFPLAQVERVEVIRGPGSALYGADAYSGVINIITKKGGGDRALSAWGNVGLGSQDTFKASAGFSGAGQGWDYSLASSYGTSDGFNATNPLSFSYNPDKNGYTQHGLNGSLGYEWAQGQHLGLRA